MRPAQRRIAVDERSKPRRAGVERSPKRLRPCRSQRAVHQDACPVRPSGLVRQPRLEHPAVDLDTERDPCEVPGHRGERCAGSRRPRRGRSARTLPALRPREPRRGGTGVTRSSARRGSPAASSASAAASVSWSTSHPDCPACLAPLSAGSSSLSAASGWLVTLSSRASASSCTSTNHGSASVPTGFERHGRGAGAPVSAPHGPGEPTLSQVCVRERRSRGSGTLQHLCGMPLGHPQISLEGLQQRQLPEAVEAGGRPARSLARWRPRG